MQNLTIKMTKIELRQMFQNKRNLLKDDDIDHLTDKIIICLSEQLNLENKKTHIFLPITKKKEINTYKIIDFLRTKKCKIIIPKSDFKNSTLNHFEYTSDTEIKITEYGIPEPINGIETSINDLEIVFIPLLCFDFIGNRLGYGKGFYDRFLSTLSKDCLKIGLSHFDAFESLLPIDKFDIRLDYCITPNRVYSFI
jgi:5-formyltetrahydrofolate cyclo-ligase